MKIPSLEGKVALVTGANTGIGKVTALELVRAGAHTTLACRNQQQAQEAIDEILAETGADPSMVEFLALDLASFDKVRESAAAFMAMELPLDILVNNAGLAGIKALSKDGFEIAFGVNHLGHFLFTHLIFERLLEADSARIVNVASRAHYRVDGIDFDKLHSVAETTTGMTSYAYSKLANVLFTSELAERLEGTDITTYSLHPGVVASDIWRKVPGPLRWIGKLFMISNEEGAQTTLYCATSPDCADESGLYYDSCKVKKPSAAAHDKELSKKLWDKSMEWTDAPELPL
jgi:NAD(P)-dependent dehydrogenase (short-subunit alcohol dehydrogenase family)